MSWVLLPNASVVEWPGTAALGDEVATGAGERGLLVGQGGPRGSETEFAPTRAETQMLANNVVARGSSLTPGDPVKFNEHFRDHRELLEKALNKRYTVDAVGQAAFLRDLSQAISSRRLQLIGAGTLAKGQPLAYIFRGNVGIARLTLVMKPGGQWQTLVRAGEGLDLRVRMLMRFDTPHPFVF